MLTIESDFGQRDVGAVNTPTSLEMPVQFRDLSTPSTRPNRHSTVEEKFSHAGYWPEVALAWYVSVGTFSDPSKEDRRGRWNKFFTVVDFHDRSLNLYDDMTKRRIRQSIPLDGLQFFDAVKTKNRPCTIKLSPHAPARGRTRDAKPLYLSSEELHIIDEFKVELEECGATFDGFDREDAGGGVCACLHNPLFPPSSGVRLDRIPPVNWNESDVREWLRQTELTGFCLETFAENNIDGTILMEMDEQQAKGIGVSDDGLPVLMREVQRLRRGGFSGSRFFVRSKFQKFGGGDFEEDFQDMIDSLCNVARLKHIFLNTSDLQAHTLAADRAGIETGKSSARKLYGQEPVEAYGREATVKVKLVVTEILQSDRAKGVRKLVSPIVDALIPTLRTDFGLFHTAIIVGPWYLEWTDSELVIPKRMVSGRAIISADVDTLRVPKDGLRSITDTIAEVVVRWNTRYKYRNTRAPQAGTNEGNCQDFVDDLLQSLGIAIDFQGALGNFLTNMRKSGRCVLEFAPSKAFRDFFEITDSVWSFETHLELDNFCIKIRDTCLEIYDIYHSEWSLLKSFDRAFWLRHLKFPEDERYLPLAPVPDEDGLIDDSEFATGCPFLDPRATKSSTLSRRPRFLSPFTVDADQHKPYHYTPEQLAPQFTLETNPFEHSGYIEVDKENEGSMYYVLFHALNGNASAPLIIWLQGGPGCSSMTGLFFEMGPYRVNPDTLKLESDPATWNRNYHMLFIDNPVGSGFSFVNKEAGYVSNEAQVADSLYFFLTQFFAKYPDLLSNDLYVFGESYAGKYVPAIGAKIWREGLKLNLKGIGIGDGLTYPERQFIGYGKFSVMTSLIGYNDLPEIEDLEKRSVEAIVKQDWKTSIDLWDETLEKIDTLSGGVNQYDIRSHEGYDTGFIDKYLALPETIKLMHTEGHPFTGCNGTVYSHLRLDMPKSERQAVIDLLDRSDVRVMLYNAQFDLIIPCDSSFNGWVREMPWHGQQSYISAERTIFKSQNKFAGWVKRYGNLVTVIMGDAGHLSPHNEPGRTQTMVTNFIEKIW